MVKEISRGHDLPPKEVLAVLHEAAQAEDRFRQLDDTPDRMQKRFDRFYWQLDHELAKLALKKIDISAAFPPEQQSQLRSREA